MIHRVGNSTTTEYENEIENGLQCADPEKARKVFVSVKLIRGALKKKGGKKCRSARNEKHHSISA
jgi:hypothetical protein